MDYYKDLSPTNNNMYINRSPNKFIIQLTITSTRNITSSLMLIFLCDGFIITFSSQIFDVYFPHIWLWLQRTNTVSESVRFMHDFSKRHTVCTTKRSFLLVYSNNSNNALKSISTANYMYHAWLVNDIYMHIIISIFVFFFWQEIHTVQYVCTCTCIYFAVNLLHTKSTRVIWPLTSQSYMQVHSITSTTSHYP